MPLPKEVHYTSAETGTGGVLSVPTTCLSIAKKLVALFYSLNLHYVMQLRCTVLCHFLHYASAQCITMT